MLIINSNHSVHKTLNMIKIINVHSKNSQAIDLTRKKGAVSTAVSGLHFARFSTVQCIAAKTVAFFYDVIVIHKSSSPDGKFTFCGLGYYFPRSLALFLQNYIITS